MTMPAPAPTKPPTMTREEFVHAMPSDLLSLAVPDRLKLALGSVAWNQGTRATIWRAILAEKPAAVPEELFTLQAMIQAIYAGFVVRGDDPGVLRFLDAAFGPIDYGQLLPAPRPGAPAGGVYFIRSGEAGPIKIGIARNVAARLNDLQIASAETLTLLALIPGGPGVERALHREFRHLRVRGEWFEPAPELLARIAALSAAQETLA